jgi:hypothetical protein
MDYGEAATHTKAAEPRKAPPLLPKVLKVASSWMNS